MRTTPVVYGQYRDARWLDVPPRGEGFDPEHYAEINTESGSKEGS
jgi:hypothetical protein